MYYTIKVLLDQGKSIRSISKDLNVDRKTVRRISQQIKLGGPSPPESHREKKLDEYSEQINDLFDKGWSARLIHRELSQKDVAVSYPSVARWVETLREKEVFVPINKSPGQEAQVDFGYFGVFMRHGKPVKVWVFAMVLSYSRHAYYAVVTNQKVETFLRCHMQAFDYFGGSTQTVKLDNLASGVVAADFFDPMIQEAYAAFLAYYGVAAVPSPVRRPEDKGKVEAGIKYVKNNFLKGLKSRDYDTLVRELNRWNEEIASQRVHGTTRKVPRQVFDQLEKYVLSPLPAERYQICEITSRKVSQLGHIQFHHNYYSVPWKLAGQNLRLESNGNVLRIYDNQTLVCTHALQLVVGQYVTRPEHQPPGKRMRSDEHYLGEVASIGPAALAWIKAVKKQAPFHWMNMARGLMSLKKSYSLLAIDKSCQRALDVGLLRYNKVRLILENGLWNQPLPGAATPDKKLGGYGHDLSFYDKITQTQKHGRT